MASVMAGTSNADTLREALTGAYQTNPTLNTQRETLRGADAAVAIAKAAGRPQVDGTVGLNRNLTRSGVIARTQGNDHNISLDAGVDVTYSLFNGGAITNNVRAAETRVEASRATLLAVEGDVLTQAVTAYMDVIRDRAVVELNQNNTKVLDTNLQATQDRFQIGDLTRTDVAQSEARLSLGRSQLAIAEGRLLGSEASYRQIVGHAPGSLAPPPPLPKLPVNVDEAVQIALSNNPDLLAISRQAVASGFDVEVARAGRLPTLGAKASGNYVDQITGPAGNSGRAGTSTSLGLSSDIPIYKGGLPAARVRQAQAAQGTVTEQVVGTERAVVQATRAAFANYEAAQRAIQANLAAVKANQLALEGNRAEQGVGTRTIIEVLNAEQELLNAQVLLVTAKRDAYVTGFQLLNAMGKATIEDLGLQGQPQGNPEIQYRDLSRDRNAAAIASSSTIRNAE